MPPPTPPNIGPSNLSSLENIKFTKNVTLSQVFLCILLDSSKHKAFKVNNKEARTTSTVSLFLTLSLTLRFLVPLLLTLNIFHILHDVKNAQTRALYWKEERKVSLIDCKLKCLSSRI